jgi:hypothetical protein
MCGERDCCKSRRGPEEVLNHTKRGIFVSDKDRAHPYEEPAYEVYKMEDM